MSADYSFQGEFEFINLSKSDPSPAPQRGKVLRHVQSYRRQRKSQQPRRLLESSKFHNLHEQGKKRIAVGSTEILPSAKVVHRSTNTPGVNQTYLPSVLELVLQSGNSDPFNSMPEPLTAAVNDLVCFERDCVYPTLQRMEFHILRSEHTFSTTWYSGSRAYLYDNLAVYGYLSRVAATMSMVTGRSDYLETAYRYRHNAVTNLRLYLEDGSDIDVIRLYRALLILLFAENALGDRAAMDKHIAILGNLFQNHHYTLTNNPSFNLYEFHSVIYQDTQIAVSSLSRTFFDLRRNGWIDQQFKPLWVLGWDILSVVRSSADQILDTYLTQELRSLFLDMQENLAATEKVRGDTIAIDQHLRYMVVASRYIFVIGRFMNYYASLDTENMLVTEKGHGLQAFTREKLEACACLCAIYWLREIAGFENVFLTKDLRIFKANHIIFKKLRQIVESLTKAKGLSGATYVPGETRLLLWILFTGALWEHRELTNWRYGSSGEERMTSFTYESAWFVTLFRSWMGIANVKSWDQCKEIFQGFLFLDAHMQNDWCIELFASINNG